MVVLLQSSLDLDALITRLGAAGCIFIDFFADWSVSKVNNTSARTDHTRVSKE